MKPYQKHVLVCSGEDCAGRGASRSAYEQFKAAVKSGTPRGAVKVTQTGCIGACGFGPNVAIYPEGVWYYGVQPTDIDEIITEHLQGGRVVSRLLFHKYGETLPDEVVRDVVCGMVFRVSKAGAHLVHDGAPYYFCAPSCMVAFRADPAAFLNASHGSHTPALH